MSEIRVPVLGRVIQLGAFYDYRTEQASEKNELLQSVKIDSSKEKCGKLELKVIDCGSLGKITSAIGLEGDEKLSFLSGLLNAKGPASLLVEEADSVRTRQAVLHASFMTKTDEISIPTRDTVPDGFTHVVSKIDFGLELFLNFSLTGETADDLEELYPELLNELQRLADGKKSTTNFENVEVTFTGDIQLSQSNLTWPGMFALLKQLPEIMLKNQHKETSKFAYLHSIAALTDNTEEKLIIPSMNADRVNEAVSCLDEFREVKSRFNEILLLTAISKFVWLKKKITSVRELLLNSEKQLKTDLTKLLYGLRTGLIESTDIDGLIVGCKSAYIDSVIPGSWLATTENQLLILNSYVKTLGALRYCSSTSVLETVIADADAKFVCSLEFNVESFTNLLFPKEIVKDPFGQTSVTESMSLAGWRGFVKTFKEFAKFHKSDPQWLFVFCSSSRIDGKLIESVLYEDGVPSLFVPPGVPKLVEVTKITSDSVSLSWQLPEVSDSTVNYLCKYRLVLKPSTIETVWTDLEVSGKETSWTVQGLQSSSEYEFKLATSCKFGNSPFVAVPGLVKTSDVEVHDQKVQLYHNQAEYQSDEASSVGKNMISQPKERFLNTILEKSHKTKDMIEPAIHQLEGDCVYEDPVNRIFRYFYGPKPPPEVEEQVILILGETGSGKSTLINAIFNYIFGVKLDDPVRIRVVNEVQKGKGLSVTDSINIYSAYNPVDSPFAFAITVIDTPGFMDTSGIEKDELTKNQLHSLFSNRDAGGIHHINAVGIVAQSGQAKITEAQKYIFNCVTSIFAKDIEENIFLLCTFADNKKPVVLQASDAANLPYTNWFPFNNCALYELKSEYTNFTQLYWEMGTKSIHDFFSKVSQITPKSISLTKEVLDERRRLKALVNGLQPQIKAGVLKLSEIRQTKDILSQKRNEIDANVNFSVSVQVPSSEKRPLKDGEAVTNCLFCHSTCHEVCYIPRNEDKAKCASMKDGKCTVCANKCMWDLHVNNGYIIVNVMVTEVRTIEDMKRKYGVAVGEYGQYELLLKNMEEFLKYISGIVTNLIQHVQESLIRLNEIALRPCSLTSAQYVEMLIETEKREAKDGFQQRIESLEVVKERALILETISTGDVREHGEQDIFLARHLFQPPTNFGTLYPEQMNVAQSDDGRDWRLFWESFGKRKNKKAKQIEDSSAKSSDNASSASVAPSNGRWAILPPG